MEDVTTQAFRRIAKRIGNPGLMFTEFVSSMAIHYGASKTLKKMQIHPEERPIGIQIFGGDPQIMADTARLCEEMGADIIDINMGCWVPKVCRTGSGAALLKDPALAEKIVQTVVRAVTIPVTVKVRAGWDWSLFAAPELAQRFQDAGVKMLTLHARFAKQGFEGEADWRLISELRQVISIPLAGNGDIRTGDDALRMFRETGCDAIMVGRAAISNPWRLAGIRAAILGASPPAPPTLEQRIEVALEHLKLTIEFEIAQRETLAEQTFDAAERVKCEESAVRSLRGQLPLYIKGEPGAAQIRNRLTICSRAFEVEQLLREYASGIPCTEVAT